MSQKNGTQQPPAPPMHMIHGGQEEKTRADLALTHAENVAQNQRMRGMFREQYNFHLKEAELLKAIGKHEAALQAKKAATEYEALIDLIDEGRVGPVTTTGNSAS